MQHPYITPKKLLGDLSLPIKCDIAFICYCPMPEIFDKHMKVDIELKHRYFIHSHNSHVLFGEFAGKNFIVIAEVYGGPMSVTTVEELHYYGINTIIGIGFVGSLINDLKIGDIIYAKSALSENGTTPHYNNTDKYIYPSDNLEIITCASGQSVWTTNALYREYVADVAQARDMGCTVVNMDTSHLYAACSLLKIKCGYYAVVSDVIDENIPPEDESWTNELISAVDTSNNNNQSPVISAQALMVSTIVSKLIE